MDSPNKNNSFDVDVSPEMQLYKVLQKQSYALESALAEFVDNSVQSFVEKNTAIQNQESSEVVLEVSIKIDSKEKCILISDNASGINRKDFQRAIRMGHGDGFVHAGTSLSVYGIGMKSAAIWFSDTWAIETSASGSAERLTTNFDLDRLLLSGESIITVRSESAKPNEHYTNIYIKNTFRELNEEYFKDTVLPYLLETFMKFDFLRIKVIFDNIVLQTDKAYLEQPEPLIYPQVDKAGEKIDDKQHTWKKRINIDYGGRKVHGFLMIMEKGGYKQPGIRLLRNKRVIVGTSAGDKRNIPQSLYQTSNKYAAQRIYGELNLDEFPVNFMKTGFDENLDGLYRLLHSELKNEGDFPDYILQAEYFRARKAKKSKGTNNKGTDNKGTDKENDKQESKQSGAEQTSSSEDNSRYITPERIQFSQELFNALNQLESIKLARFYKSLCRISLINDPILAYVSAWSFLESLTNLLGKAEKTDFPSYFNTYLNKMYPKKTERKAYTLAFQEISDKGNMNKHHGTYETINAQQLANDFKQFEPVLLNVINIRED